MPITRQQWRVLGTATVAALAGVVGVLAWKVHDRRGPLTADRVVSVLLNQPRVATKFHHYRLGRLDSVAVLRIVQHLGSPGTIAMLTGAVAVWTWRRGDRVGAITAATSVAAAGLLAENILKPLIDRPATHGWYFPSGHATGVTALAASCVLLASRGRSSRLITVAVVTAAAAVAVAAVSVALIQLHAHYASDVVAGVALGAACAIVGFLVTARPAMPALNPLD